MSCLQLRIAESDVARESESLCQCTGRDNGTWESHDLATVGVVRFQIGFDARIDLQRTIGPWPLAGLAEPAGAALRLSTVLRTIGATSDVFDHDGELNPRTDVGESRLVGLEAPTNASENFVQVDHEVEHEHKPLTLNLYLQLHKRESSTLSTAQRER
jgi:hypothetical protein